MYDHINQRNISSKDNNRKISIYAWVNNINNQVYKSSEYPLYIRLSDYYLHDT